MSAIKKLILIFLFYLPLFGANGNDFTHQMPDLQIDEKKLKELVEVIIKDPLESPEVKEMLKPVRTVLNSPEWQEKLAKNQEGISKMFRHESKGGVSTNAKINATRLDRPVLFVSSSMPILTLRNYARDIAKAGGVMVIKGGLDGLHSLKKTMKFTADVLKKDSSCTVDCKMQNTAVLIDPILFRRYQIKQVPALVYQKNLNIESHCGDATDDNKSSNIVYGDASIKTLALELLEMGEFGVQNMIDKL